MTPSSAMAAVGGELGFLQRMARSALSILEVLADKLPYILMGALFFALAWWISRLTARLTRAALARTSTEGHVDVLLGRFAAGVVLAVGFIVSLGIMGVQVSALVTSLGLAGVTIGFALKDVLANSMAGVLLLLQRPFTIGDVITVAGCEGTVRDIRVRDTLIERADGRMIFVPNATVFNEPITNTSVASRRRVEVVTRIPLSADLEVARAAALAGMERVPGADPLTPADAVYTGVGVASAALCARVWVDTGEVAYGTALDAAISGVNAALRGAGVAPAEVE